MVYGVAGPRGVFFLNFIFLNLLYAYVFFITFIFSIEKNQNNK